MSSIDQFNSLWQTDVVAQLQKECNQHLYVVHDQLYDGIVKQLRRIYKETGRARRQLQSLSSDFARIRYSLIPSLSLSQFASSLHYYCTDDQDINLVRRVYEIKVKLTDGTVTHIKTSYHLVTGLWCSSDNFRTLQIVCSAHRTVPKMSFTTIQYDILCMNTAQPIILDLLQGLQSQNMQTEEWFRELYDGLFLKYKFTSLKRKETENEQQRKTEPDQ